MNSSKGSKDDWAGVQLWEGPSLGMCEAFIPSTIEKRKEKRGGDREGEDRRKRRKGMT